MGTNYYLHIPGCEKDCGHCSERQRIHLGKSSAGWKFGHYAPPDWPRDQARTMWRELIDVHLLNGGHIEDEYGGQITRDGLLEFIEEKQHLRSHLNPHPYERTAWAARNMTDLYDNLQQAYFDCDGYDFCDREFS
jgi:hypothetical protein